MAIGYFLRVGDKTTCGGQILTGDNTMQWYGVAGAREGDMVSCGKHSGGYILLVALAVCGWKIGNMPGHQKASVHALANDNNKIRIDAQHLIDCADELCEKHLYYPEVKSEFKSDIETFAYQIVDQVESGQKSYEQGSAELKQEEKSLLEQSLNWLTNGLSIFWGADMVWAGGALCGTGLGCIIGAPLIAHGANGIYEGVEGLVEGRNDIDTTNVLMIKEMSRNITLMGVS